MMKWKTIVRCEVGTSHQKRQMPCQDYGHYVLIEDLNAVVGAVADGSGSAKYSEVGSKLAVDTVLSHLKEYLEWLNKEKIDLRQPISEAKAREVFGLTLARVVNVLKTKASASLFPLKELACTLLAFVATPDWIAAMQIGDGFIVVRCLEDSSYRLLFTPIKGEYASQTTFVTSSNALSEMKVTVLSGNKKFICASTDGLERVALNICDWIPGEIFFQPLEQYMQMSNDPEKEDKYIVNFLQSERLNTRTEDDKTLLLCMYDEDTKQQLPSPVIDETEKSVNSSIDTALLFTENTKQSPPNNISSGQQIKPKGFPTLENADELIESSITSYSTSEEKSQEFLPTEIYSEEHTEQISVSSEIKNTEKLANSSDEIPHLSEEKTKDNQSI